MAIFFHFGLDSPLSKKFFEYNISARRLYFCILICIKVHFCALSDSCVLSSWKISKTQTQSQTESRHRHRHSLFSLCRHRRRHRQLIFGRYRHRRRHRHYSNKKPQTQTQTQTRKKSQTADLSADTDKSQTRVSAKLWQRYRLFYIMKMIMMPINEQIFKKPLNCCRRRRTIA